MILYFSGIGNSRYAAKQIGEKISEELFFIPDLDALKLKFTGRSLGFVFPVYAWGVPEIVLSFIEKIPESVIENIKNENVPVWMVCTCGDETGRTPEMLQKALEKRGLNLKGAWSVIMPNTYVLLPGFDVDSKELEESKLKNAVTRIGEIGEKISRGKWEWSLTRGSLPGLRTKLGYPLFKWMGISTDKWHHTSACIRCGKCAKACPVKNIAMENDGPAWGNNCLSCLACYHICPVHAVEYGSATKKKGQYYLPADL